MAQHGAFLITCVTLVSLAAAFAAASCPCPHGTAACPIGIGCHCCPVHETCIYLSNHNSAPVGCRQIPRHPRAILHIHPFGRVVVQLYPFAAPVTVANFIQLAESGFMNGTHFYRFVKDFVLQGGAYNGASNNTVPLEYRLPNVEWSVGLARGELPHSGSSEFFVNLANNTDHLMPGGVTKDGYCVFGKIAEGFQVIEKLLTLPTHYSEADQTTEFNEPWPVISSISIDRGHWDRNA